MLFGQGCHDVVAVKVAGRGGVHEAENRAVFDVFQLAFFVNWRIFPSRCQYPIVVGV